VSVQHASNIKVKDFLGDYEIKTPFTSPVAIYEFGWIVEGPNIGDLQLSVNYPKGWKYFRCGRSQPQRSLEKLLLIIK